MTTVLDRVRQTVEQYHLLAPGEMVVVGVSGGPDSLCLLHVLCRLRGEYGLSLHVAHLHHGLRGAEADADAEFVRALAADWSLPCTVERADVPALARAHRLAVEEAARRARYAFLAQVAGAVGAHTIAVGHHADDQTETVLMHWLRGSGLAGLRGMLPLTSLSDYRLLSPMLQGSAPLPNLRLIRPLLEVTRAEIMAYCDHYRLNPRFDRSNLDTTYFRNWLRHEVLPLLARHNPNVREVIRRSARVIADDYALLRTLLEEAWSQVVLPATRGSGDPSVPLDKIVFKRSAWQALPPSLQRATLREAIHRLRWSLRDINFIHVENALQVARDGTTGAQATLPRGLMLTVGYEHLVIADAETAGLPSLPDWPLLPVGSGPLAVAVPGDTELPGSEWRLRAKVCDRADLPPDWEVNPDPWRAYLDAEAVGPRPALRTRRPADRFQPLGLGGHTVKLADFWTNQKVPRALRDRLPLLIGEVGIAWVCGWRVDERARVHDRTERVLLLSFLPVESIPC
ncbi:MAG: tRNA lysidine(34) synthetase TilS [Anaerolineae bacterium]